MIDRRQFIAGTVATLPLSRLAAAPPAPLRVSPLGQSLIQQDLRQSDWPDRITIARRLAGADAVFSDLETAISGPRAGTSTRQGEVVHTAPPAVIDCLQSVGIDLMATSNNHAWDLGTAGIGSALAELDARGISHAGSGADLDQASKAAIRETRHGTVALVAGAAGAIRDGAAATPSRAGVNELRRSGDGLDADDVARMLAEITAARQSGAAVIAYLHNHYWEKDLAATPAWQRSFARSCIDAGAAIFVSHGPPLLQGIETYRGVPLLHGLGSFIFQTRKSSYGPATWQSLMVEVAFRNGRFIGGTATPLILDSRQPANSEFSLGTPGFADRKAAADILDGVRTNSERLGYKISVRGRQIVL